MDRFQEYVDALLKVQLSDLLAVLDQTVNNPLANLQASLLILASVVVITLIAVVAAIMLLGFSDDDDEEGEEGDFAASMPSDPPVRASGGGASAPRPAPVPLTPEQRRLARAQSVLFGTLAVVVVWGAFSVTTASETMCLSCHRDDMPHAERSLEKPEDPHAQVNCIRCHESGTTLGYLTYDVGSRVGHYALGVASPKRAQGYGVPITGGACSSCHTGLAAKTVTVEDRGVRVSHKEPLDAGATCTDCHELQKLTGVIGGWTVGMSSCLRCHDNVQASAECDSCHTKDIAFAVHSNTKPEPKRQIVGKRCYTCHEKAACDSCHGTTMPHSENFKRVGHAYEATLDNWYNGGRGCQKCHPNHDMCLNSCHNKGAFPGHPIGIWPSIHGNRPEAGYDSCDSCHGGMAYISGRNFCGVCHEQYKEIRP